MQGLLPSGSGGPAGFHFNVIRRFLRNANTRLSIELQDVPFKQQSGIADKAVVFITAAAMLSTAIVVPLLPPMDESLKNMFDVVFGVIQAITVLGGICWAAYRFRAEGTHNPRIEFSLNAQFMGPVDDQYVVQVIIHAKNRGLRIREFPSIKLTARGIERGGTIEWWPNNEPRLLLPDKIIDKAEVIYTRRYSHVFVEPGVEQELTYLTRIPSKYRFISFRAVFSYDAERSHSTERLFDIDSTQHAGESSAR